MSATDASTIPQRGDIEEQYKWKLEDIYKSEEDWEAEYKRAQGLIARAKEFTGKLADSAELLYECLSIRTDLHRIVHNLFQYAKLNQDLDNRVSKYQAMTERAVVLDSQISAAYSFVEPELNGVEDSKLRELAGKFPKTDEYDFYIEDLIRSRAHIREQEVEEVLAQASVISRGPFNSFTMLDDADLKYPKIKDEDGNELQLTKQRVSKIMSESQSQDVRQAAHEGLHGAYKEHINTLGALIGSSVNKDVFYSRVRRFESSLHQALFAHNIPVEVYHKLLDTTEANLAPLHKWMKVRKKILKLDTLYPYDTYCQLFPEQSYEVPYEEAVHEVIKAVEPLGKEYNDALKKAFENRWVDVYETEGKGSGAYSWGNFDAHSYVLMNYNDTINNMFTLAHEMGHALHSHFSNKAQPFAKSHYATFVAEVASTLNEGLLLQRLLKKADDDKKKLFLLNRQIDNTFGTFFNQVFFARFELWLHETVENGGALSPDMINEKWEGLTRQYYGPEVTIDDYSKYKWARIPHFYMTYYVYQYATSYAASQAILAKFLSGEEGIIPKYLELISSGGKDYPIELLKNCEVDMTTPDPVNATLKLFSEQVDEVDSLT
ncbi:MAG: oligoendopeptidase F [candidate division Zixibacteria bacterium]|nr:oligoendopeptidase F [candidate division Zixibacteria bacterium]